MIADGDLNRISLDQLKALEKMLPDSGQVCVCVRMAAVCWLAVNRTQSCVSSIPSIIIPLFPG